MIKTTCAKCIFRINDEMGMQIACKKDRLEILKEKNLAFIEDGSYIIQRFCNYCRDINWTQKLGINTKAEIDERLRFETDLKFTVIFTPQNIKYLDSFLNVEYPVKFIFFNNLGKMDRGDIAVKLCGNDNITYRFVDILKKKQMRLAATLLKEDTNLYIFPNGAYQKGKISFINELWNQRMETFCNLISDFGAIFGKYYLKTKAGKWEDLSIYYGYYY